MFGQRLRLARKKAGVSMQQLADQLGPPLSVQTIRTYEKDEMMPSSSVMVQLGKTLDVSLDFLMAGQVRGLRRIEFRPASRISAQDRAATEIIVIERLENYLTIEAILEILHQPEQFGKLRNQVVHNYEDAENLAIRLRKHWALNLDPIPSMIRLFEEKGIRIIEAKLPVDVDGLACEVELLNKRMLTQVLVVSQGIGVERKRINLAYELAHRVIADVDSKLKKEKARERFAGAFLVPAAHLKEEIGDAHKHIAYHEIVRLKQFYGVSASVLLMRIKDLNIMASGIIDQAFRTFAGSWCKTEPEPIAQEQGIGAFEAFDRYQNLVWRALGEELISPFRAAQMLNKPLKTIEREIRGSEKQYSLNS